MRKILLLIIVLLLSNVADSMKYNSNTIKSIDTISVTIDSWDLLIYKIMKHETANFTKFTGDNGKAVGYMHMWKSYVDDINQIQDSVTFTYEDRMDSIKCIKMFNIYQTYWNPSKDIETALAIHNGGPKCRFISNRKIVENYLNKFEL